MRYPVRCSECDVVYELSYRAQEIRPGRVVARCRACRRPCPEPDAADYAFWRKRFSPEEIAEMAMALRDMA